MFSINALLQSLFVKQGTRSIRSLADFFFPLFLATGHGLLAVIIEYKGGAGTLCSATPCAIILFLLDAHEVSHKWS